jgi:hypothetical protein
MFPIPWVLSVPFALRFLFASNPAAMGEALRIVYRATSGFLVHKAGLTAAAFCSSCITAHSCAALLPLLGRPKQ